MSAQVDHDLLADYLGGALDGTPEADRVAQLITSSPQWASAARTLSSALGAVADDLHALRGTPEVMPPEIVSRFDDLLASPAMAPPRPQPAQDPLAARTPTRNRSLNRRLKQWAAPIAVAGAAIAFFALGPTIQAQYDSSEGTAAEPPTAVTDSKGSDPELNSSGRTYSRQSLAVPAAGDSLVPEQGLQSPSIPRAMTNNVPALQRFNDQAALQACTDAVLATRPGKITFLDFAHFEGIPALVMSITTPTGRWVFAAGAACGVNGADEIYSAPLP